MHRLLNLFRNSPPEVPRTPVVVEAEVSRLRTQLDRLNEKHSRIVDEYRTLGDDVIATMEGLLRHYEPPKDGDDRGTPQDIVR